MRIKICGITNKEDAINAASLGADALGFIFYSESSRYVSAEQVQEMLYFLPPFFSSVGVFVNEDIEVLNQIVQDCHLDFVQLHGDESVDYCMQVKAKVIKAIRVDSLEDIQKISAYQGVVSAILLDTKVPDAYGGTGKVFDWGLALAAKDFEVPIILSGGLKMDNIKKAVQLVNPYAVDFNSGVEQEPGKKDYNKMQELIHHIHEF